VTTAQGDTGAGVVGETVTSPWVPGGPWEINQQYGQTSYAGEPAGHGASHWHAGVDLGTPSGTEVHFPKIVQSALGQMGVAAPGSELTGTAHYGVGQGGGRYRDDGNWNGGYGAQALTVTLDISPGGPSYDVLLGHGSARLVSDGQKLRSGDLLLRTNNEGASTGPHLHFEVRDQHGGAYGSDVDPWAVLTTGQAAGFLGAPTDPLSALTQELGKEVTAAEQALQSALLGGGQVALGVVMLAAGLFVVVRGRRGMAQLQRAARTAIRPAPARRGPAQPLRRSQDRQTVGRPITPQTAPEVRTGVSDARRSRTAPGRQAVGPGRVPSEEAVGAGALGKLRRGVNPNQLTPREAAWLQAHPEALRAAVQGAGR
jgi:murein DD-endopeptidase MepM/ murein hydrolase activator NlpD